MVASKSFASLRLRPLQAKNSSTTQRVNNEADLIGNFAHDLDRDQRGLGDLLTRIPAVGETPLDERKDAARDLQKRSATVAVLNACRMRFEHEATPISIDKRMALASFDPFARIITTRSAGLSRLEA
jgi:hypothetical protein